MPFKSHDDTVDAVDNRAFASSVAPLTPSLNIAPVLQLQRTIGNQATARIVARQAARRAPTGVVSTGSLRNFRPATGIGQFDADYAAGGGHAPGTLRITLKLVYLFPRTGWSPVERSAYQENAARLIGNAWSGRYIVRPRNHQGSSPVRVDVQVQTLGRSQAAQAHYTIDVTEPPPGRGPDRDAVYRPSPLTTGPSQATLWESGDRAVPDEHTNPLRSGGTSRSAVSGTGSDAMSRPFYFALGSAELPAQERVRLSTLQRELRGVTSHWEVHVRGYASTQPGEANSPTQASSAQDARANLALARARTVANLLDRLNPLIETLMHPMPDTAPTQDFRKVEIAVFRQTDQRIVLHEAGHMLGLGDEYVETDPARRNLPGRLRPGDRAAHSSLTERAWRGPGLQGGGQPSHLAPVMAGGDADSIMEGGMELRPQHYIGFLDALARLTHTTVENWEIDS